MTIKSKRMTIYLDYECEYIVIENWTTELKRSKMTILGDQAPDLWNAMINFIEATGEDDDRHPRSTSLEKFNNWHSPARNRNDDFKVFPAVNACRWNRNL